MWAARFNHDQPRFQARLAREVRTMVARRYCECDEDLPWAWRKAYRAGWRVIPVTIQGRNS